MSANESAFAPLSAEGLSIVPRLESDGLRIAMSGAIDMREPGDLLNPYWTAVDEEARRRGVRKIEVDLRDLNFMNSSGILTLVRWITRAKNSPSETAYAIVLKYDRNVTWQRTSVPTLAKLAPHVVVSMEING